jgi:hypothetical protein
MERRWIALLRSDVIGEEITIFVGSVFLGISFDSNSKLESDSGED